MHEPSTARPAVPSGTLPFGGSTDTPLDHVLEFHPKRRRQGILVALLVAAFGVALTVSTGAGLASFPLLWRALAMLAVAVPAIGFAVMMMRQAMSPKPVVRLDGQGISGAALPEPVPWAAIDDAVLDRSSRAGHLRLVLKPDPRRPDRRNFLNGRNPSRPQFSLHMLSPEQHEDVFYAVHARLAVLQPPASAGSPAGLREVRSDDAFEERLDLLTPRAWALYAVVAINLLVWAMNLAAGIDFKEPSAIQLYAWGANSASAVVVDGEWWRLLTAAFLHGGITHIAFNMLGLWDSGKQLCRLLGNWQFTLIYLAAALCGSAASLHYAAQASTSVGASGAIFGVLGALLAASFKHRRHLPAYNRGRLWIGLGIFVAYSLVSGLNTKGIDNAAHIGGLVCGIAMGLLLRAPFDPASTLAQRRWLSGLGAVATAAAVLLGVLATPIPSVWIRQAYAAPAVLQPASLRFEAAFRQFAVEERRLRAGQLTELQFLQNAERAVVLPCRDITASVTRLGAPLWDPVGRVANLHARICENYVATLKLELARVRQEPGPAADSAAQLARLAKEREQLGRELVGTAMRQQPPGAADAASRRR